MTLSPLEKFYRGQGALRPNDWHRPTDGRGGVHQDLWMCLTWDVRRKPNGRWHAEYLYRDRPAVEFKEFATAEAAMRAVDVYCSERWC